MTVSHFKCTVQSVTGRACRTLHRLSRSTSPPFLPFPRSPWTRSLHACPRLSPSSSTPLRRGQAPHSLFLLWTTCLLSPSSPPRPALALPSRICIHHRLALLHSLCWLLLPQSLLRRSAAARVPTS